jgi:hypothetical protein
MTEGTAAVDEVARELGATLEALQTAPAFRSTTMKSSHRSARV